MNDLGRLRTVSAPWARGPVFAAVALLVLVSGCNDAVVAEAVGAAFGERCSDSVPCVEPLACVDDVCQPTADAAIGEACIIGGDCAEGLSCDTGFCAAAGEGVLGAPCDASLDCAPGLRCALGAGTIATCASAGEGYVDARCTSALDCLDGLVCDPATSSCRVRFSEPSGTPCTADRDCAPDAGFYCGDADTCVGLGPDGAPIPPPWSGVSCSNAGDGGSFEVRFDPPSAGSEDFFRLPFPNDGVRGAQGLTLDGFPTPPSDTAAGAVVSALVAAAEDDPVGFASGFGPQQAVFMRFSAPPVFCGRGCGEESAPASENGCMGAAEPEPSVYVVDLTKNEQGDFLGFNTGLGFFWVADTSDRPYICGPWITVRPERVTTAPSLSPRWKPGHTYLVFVHRRVRGCSGEERVSSTVDPDFAAMLNDTAPSDSVLATLWQAYAPLREWLATSPTYPGDGTPVSVEGGDILGGAVFTARDPSDAASAVSATVTNVASSDITGVVVCDGSDAAPSDCLESTALTEIRGDVALPNFQLPDDMGREGGIELDAGAAVAQGKVTARFAISLPTGGAPATGWPVVVYAHGTGGSERSHLVNGIASLLAEVDGTGFAVVGIEQVGHGTRGRDGVDPELVVFDVDDPRSTRGNFIQATADQLTLARSITVFSSALEAQLGAAGPLLDPGRVHFLGHSQGATAVALATPVQDEVSSVVLSGAGGFLLETLNGKTSPFDAALALRVALSDPTLSDTRLHPVLNLFQGFYEEADPANFGRRFARAPLPGRAAKNVLHIVGVGDSFTPNAAGLNLARANGGVYADTSNSGLLEASDPTANAGDFPLSATEGSVTVVTSIHPAPSGRDGHFVLFEDGGKAAERAARFLADSAEGSTPGVVE